MALSEKEKIYKKIKMVEYLLNKKEKLKFLHDFWNQLNYSFDDADTVENNKVFIQNYIVKNKIVDIINNKIDIRTAYIKFVLDPFYSSLPNTFYEWVVDLFDCYSNDNNNDVCGKYSSLITKLKGSKSFTKFYTAFMGTENKSFAGGEFTDWDDFHQSQAKYDEKKIIEEEKAAAEFKAAAEKAEDENTFYRKNFILELKKQIYIDDYNQFSEFIMNTTNNTSADITSADITSADITSADITYDKLSDREEKKNYIKNKFMSFLNESIIPTKEGIIPSANKRTICFLLSELVKKLYNNNYEDLYTNIRSGGKKRRTKKYNKKLKSRRKNSLVRKLNRKTRNNNKYNKK